MLNPMKPFHARRSPSNSLPDEVRYLHEALTLAGDPARPAPQVKNSYMYRPVSGRITAVAYGSDVGSMPKLQVAAKAK